MPTKKTTPSKAATRKAGKILRNPMSSKGAKSAAAQTLSKASVSKRTVRSAPRAGTITRLATKRAVARVTTSRSKKK